MMMIVVAGLLLKDGRLLIAQRPLDKHMGGCWEFPGGKVEEGETPEEALRRELREELDIEIEVGRIYHAVAQRYPEKNALLLFYRCRLINGVPRPVEEADVRWAKAEELETFHWADADLTVMRQILVDGFEAL